MATAPLSNFPIVFEKLLLTAFANQPYVLKMPTQAKAKAFRMKVYGYFNALKAEDKRKDLIDMANSLTIKYADGELVFCSHEDQWEAQLIKEALGIPNVTPSSEINQLYVSPAIKKLEEVRAKRAAAAANA